MPSALVWNFSDDHWKKWARKETTGCNLSETGSKLARPMGVVGAAVAAEVMATAVAVEEVVADHPMPEV